MLFYEPLPVPPPMNFSKSRIPFMRSLSIHFPIYKSPKNDLISDDQLPCCKPIRSILSVTAVPVHLPVINLYYEVREPHDHNSACCTGLFIVISLRTCRKDIVLHPDEPTYRPYANQSRLLPSHTERSFHGSRELQKGRDPFR